MSDETENRKRSGSMIPYDPSNGWSDDIEEICESIRQNSAAMSEKHKKLYSYYNGQLKYYKIPVIIISGFNSVIAVGLQPYMDQGLISASNCLLALLCGIIGSIELFLGIQTSMETEMAASKAFYLLAANIYRTLSLERSHRGHPGKEYLEEVYTEYSKLFENSALIQTKMVDKLATVPKLRQEKGFYSSASTTPDITPTRKRDKIKSLFSSSPSPQAPSPPALIDPSHFLEMGQANMIKPEEISGLGKDLLAGKGFMEDMAPLQGAIHSAVGAAASSYEQFKDGSIIEAAKEQAMTLAKEQAIAEAKKLAQAEIDKAKQEAEAELQKARDELSKMKDAAQATKDAAQATKDATTSAIDDATKGVASATKHAAQTAKGVAQATKGVTQAAKGVASATKSDFKKTELKTIKE